MSDWKNDRAEAEMKSHEAEMMQKALEKKKKELDEKWNKISSELRDFCDKNNYTSQPLHIVMPMVLAHLREKYELPTEKK